MTCSLIRIFTVGFLDSQGCKVSSCGQWRHWSDCTDMQINLSLHWMHFRRHSFSCCGSDRLWLFRFYRTACASIGLDMMCISGKHFASYSFNDNIHCGNSLEAPVKCMLWVLMYVVGTHLKCLTEALQMRTHNIHFYGEIRKMLILFVWKINLI